MATQLEDIADEVEGVEVETLRDEADESDAPQGEGEGQAQEVDVSEGAPEDLGLVLDLSGEAEADEPVGIRNLRNRVKELTAKVKQYEKTIPATQAEALPPEPELEDFDYDTAAFKAAHSQWVRKSLDHEKRVAEQQEAAQRVEQRWQSRLAYYDEAKDKLGVQDYEDAEATVSEIFSTPFPGILADDVRLGIIKQGAKDPAALVYALAKNPAKAKELAAIDDPVEFAWKASALEAGMKINRAGAKPAPERKIGGTVPGVAGAMDNTLERLRAEAEKTGDYSKVTRYKREKGLKG